MSNPIRSGFMSIGALLPFVLVTTLFFMWGIPNNLNGVLIKQFMKSMEISRFQAGLIQSAFYMGYFALAVPAAMLMRRFSYKTGIVFGLFLYAAGCLLFWPAAIIGQYGFFLLALFVIASGLAFLETGANPFIALLGNPESSEQRLNFSQAFNPIGSVVGVLLGTIFIFSGVSLPLTISLVSSSLTEGGMRNNAAALLPNLFLRLIPPFASTSNITWFPLFQIRSISDLRVP